MIGILESPWWLWRGVAWLGTLSTVLWLVTRLFPKPCQPEEQESTLEEAGPQEQR